uniref:NADH-ubiquinone oxidoreductase chain 3 n=1 Tax=Omus cazieri TaxID=1343352 RepID=A0A343EYR8_9CARA|nr:NADH dehydrogenase subunit 3 [Omus cazieri]
MLMMFMMGLILFLISLILMIIANILSKKTFMDREKNSPFECGFDPFNSARMPFSIHFFLIAVIFLIFDVEITMLVPMISIIKLSNSMSWMLVTFFFLLILLIGLYHEWNQGALTWAK